MAAAQDAAQATKNLDGVVVTGSRIKRAEVEGPTPVTVISGDQMKKEGFVSVFDALQTITQSSGEAIGEVDTGSFAPQAKQVNLRGLGAGRTLLLINGRRAADYPWANGNEGNFASFGNIPAAAVERIEVLSAGASAIYGSDAVAGVINIVLKKHVEGDTVTIRGGTSTRGGRDSYDLQWVGGVSNDKGSLTYAFEATGSEALFASQRDFTDSLRDSPVRPDPRLGFEPTITHRITRENTRGLSPADNGKHYAPPPGVCDRFGFEPFTDRRIEIDGSVTELGSVCGDAGQPAKTLSTEQNNLSGYLYGTWNFDNGVEAWGSLMAYYAKAVLGAGMLSVSGPQRAGQPITSIWYDPQFGRNISARRRLIAEEHGGEKNALQRFTEKSFDVAFGLRGTIADRFDWDFTLSRAEYSSDMRRTLFNSARVSEYFFGQRLDSSDPACAGAGTTPCYRLNLDRWYTPLSNEQYLSLADRVLYDNRSWVNTASFVISGDLFDLPAGPLGFAAVLDTASQGYDTNPPYGLRPQVRTNYGLVSTSGGGERDRYALGVELRIPILDTLKASLAGRFDKYDDITDVNDARTWSAGLEWRPLGNLLLRANYGTSFKAPDMHFVFNEGTGGRPVSNDYYRCLSQPGGSFGSGGVDGTCSGTTYSYAVDETTQGDPTLEEETGKSWGLGVVWDVTDALALTVDYYDIEMEGQIRSLNTDYILESEGGCRTGLRRNRDPFPYAANSSFCRDMLARVTREAAPGELTDRVTHVQGGYINQAYRRLSGIDATLNWRMPTERFGDFRWSVGWSHTLSSELQEYADAPVDKDYRDDPYNWAFRSRARASVGWTRDTWSANVFMSRVGSLPEYSSPAGAPSRTAPFLLWNVNLGKQITDKAKITLFVNNVFDATHPKDHTHGDYPFFKGVYSAIGREVSAQLEYRFD